MRPGAGFSFELPFLELAGQLVQALVAAIAGLADFSFGEGLTDGAAGLFPVGAVWKLAMAEILGEAVYSDTADYTMISRDPSLFDTQGS